MQFGGELAVRFETAEHISACEGWKFPNERATQGHCLRLKRYESPLATTYVVERTSLATSEKIKSAVARGFPKDDFHLYQQVEGTTLLDTFFIVFEKKPSEYVTQLVFRDSKGNKGDPLVSEGLERH
ncbi:hypothetical protein A1O3_00159 [Capronia epimyces CBS 606.96]|uniref:Uncharacterized protein n=1 Tax=Capronia epimyces CBS 606.96 TaxID=1182542 RepID=W9YQR8_9EURO|nr:uncharacterized protein A1O3_00159 [Capronia epimyces CBS 606.96]EXJ91611.1 hypothetical protein A1O3_00159 [Capronia epimyces CBS 606.96]